MVYALIRSYSLIVVSVLLTVIVIMAQMINPPTVSKTDAELKAPGDIVAHIVWPNGNIDVDLWLSGPGEPGPVGYTHKGGVIWNLLRDDLGALPDATPVNYEDAFTRGIVPGEYIINVQCYRCELAQMPLPVDVAVSLRDRSSSDERLVGIVTSRVLLKLDGEEKTAVRFIVKQDLTVDMDSINNNYFKLRGSKVKDVGGMYAPYFDNGGVHQP